MIITCSNEGALKNAMYKKIDDQLKSIHLGNSKAKRIILIVPAQATLKTEEDCFNMLGGNGFFDLLVMSGAKLREDILNETGKPSSTAINTVGRNMILRKLSKKNASKLKSFKNVASEEGFIDMISDLMVQLKHNKVETSHIAKACESVEESSLLSDKLWDLNLLYSEYEACLADKYTDSDDLIEFSTGQISKSQFVAESIIWYYDFYSFTNNEYAFLSQLRKNCLDLNFAILSDNEQYICGQNTASKLSARLELPLERIDSKKEIHPLTRIISCASIYSQSQTIANDILKRIRENNWKYDDFAVLSQDESARENIKRVFQSLDIPYFMDEKRSLDYSALARFISDLFEVIINNYRPSDVVSFVKSSLLNFDHGQIDDFSNYVIQFKIYNKAFLNPFKHGTTDPKYENAEKLRSNFVSIVSAFESMIKTAKTAEDYTRALYNYLIDNIDILKKLEDVSQAFENANMLDAMQEINQSWGEFVSLLDQLVELMGKEEMTIEEYKDILISSIADIKIGVLPQADGKVLIGSVTRSSFSDIKALYIGSFNDGILPSDARVDSLLTDKELSKVSDIGLEFYKSHELLQSEEMFQINRALNSECNSLTLLYTASDADGGEQMISPMLLQLSKDQNIEIEEDIDDTNEGLGYLQNRKSSSSKLLQFLKLYLAGKEIPEEWKLCANYLKDDQEFNMLSRALFFNPGTEALNTDVIEKVFSKQGSDRMSPSQLETYAACPFKHFVEYGLHPDKQERFQVDSAKSGTIYHEVLQKISEKLNEYSSQNQVDVTDRLSLWMKISDEEIAQLVQDILEEIKNNEFDGLLVSSPEEEYRFDRIRVLSLVFAKYMIEQLRKGHVSSMYFERKFGEGGQLPPLTIDTKLGKVRIEGVIDRTDVIENQHHCYAKIIDYKSGNKDFDMDRLQLGLDLQLMIYLEAAVGPDNNMEAGGVFYYLVHNPEFDSDLGDIVSGEISDDLAKKLSKKYALEGVALKDDTVLSSIDTEIVNINDFKTDTINIHGGKSLLTMEEFTKLRTDFRIVLTNLCEKLKSGNIDINPTIYKGEKPGCQYCDFRSICVKDFAYK